jgi:DNA-binding MarR family transcriptional regulator
LSAVVPPGESQRDILQRVIDERLAHAGRLAVFTNLARVSLLVDALQQDSLGALKLNFVDYSILRVLQISGPPYQLSPSRLANAVVRSTGGMTKIIDRLEQRGLVERIRDAEDRRGVLVHLTRAGCDLATEASKAYTIARTGVLAALEESDIDTANRSITQLLAALERRVT